MEKANIPLVQHASTPAEVFSQLMAFAEEQGGVLALSVKYASTRIADPRDRLDEMLWQFKIHAPEGYTLNTTTHSPILSHYSWIPLVHDH